MPRIALIRAAAVVPFTEFLESIGAPLDRLLGDVGLSPEILADEGRLVPLRQCLEFIGKSASSEGVRELGLIVGQRTLFERLGPYGRLVQRGATVREALEDLITAIGLFNSGDILWLSRSGGRVLFCHRFDVPGQPGWVQGDLFAVSMMIGAVRAAVDPGWVPAEVRIPWAGSLSRKACEEILGVPVVCAADFSAVVFPAKLLSAPNRAHRGDATGAAAHAYLCATAPSGDLVGAVRQAIAAFLIDGYPDIGRIARAVGFSVRTLQRRLAEDGVSYSDLVDAARHEASLRLLSQGEARLVEIAGALGYTDQANFTRAFRRWTGKSPRTFRRGVG